MKRVLAFLCVFVLLFGSALCESQASTEEITETPMEELNTVVEVTEAPPEEIPEEIPESIVEPTEEPTPEPTEEPTPEPTEEPTPEPTPEPTVEITSEPTPIPTPEAIEADTEPENTNEVASDQVVFEEDDWGEISIEFKREVYITFAREPKVMGDTVTLVASLVNFKPEDRYTISWQYSENGQDWVDIIGEDERTYTFILDRVNCHYYFRVVVNLEEE